MKKQLLYKGKANISAISQEDRILIMETWNENRSRLIFKDSIVIEEESKKLWKKAKEFKDSIHSMPDLLKGNLDKIHIPLHITKEEVKYMRSLYKDKTSTSDYHKRLLDDRIKTLKLYQGISLNNNRGSIEYGQRTNKWGINYIPLMVMNNGGYFDLSLNYIIGQQNSINDLVTLFDNMTWENDHVRYKLPKLVDIKKLLNESLSEI